MQASYDDTIATLKESAEATITQQNTDNNVTMSEAEFNTAVEKEIDAAFEAMYFTRESYMDYLELYAIMDKVQDKVTEGLAPTEEQIQTSYDEKVAAAKEDYEETPKNYESAFVNGSVIYYVPDGVRVVQHILISLTDEQQEELSTLRSEDKNDEADAKREEYLAGIKAEADEVLGKISADHANFLDVMKENSDDTASADGMEFAVAPGGGYYAEDFMNAALAMKEVGETVSYTHLDVYKRQATAQAYIQAIFTDFVELHGDRCYGDDPAVLCGLARLNGRPVTVVALEKGVDTAEKVRRNFGAAHPEGYRKALRQMKLAEKFHRPVICLVDTSGAYCGIGAEERGQGQAIAQNPVSYTHLDVYKRQVSRSYPSFLPRPWRAWWNGPGPLRSSPRAGNQAAMWAT